MVVYRRMLYYIVRITRIINWATEAGHLADCKPPIQLRKVSQLAKLKENSDFTARSSERYRRVTYLDCGLSDDRLNGSSGCVHHTTFLVQD